jgi:plasmid stabilization system protein ParE
MALEIFWSKRADNKFDKIPDYLSAEWGDRVTSAFVKKVYDFLDVLVEFPEIGTIEHVERNIRGFVLVRQITIFYKVSGNSIILLNFFDNRQNPKKKNINYVC